MAFRRDHQDQEWTRWRREYNNLIIAARVPEFIVESRRHWLSFLDNGYLEESGPSRQFNFDVQGLPNDEQETLLQLIETYPDGPESEAARRLRQSLKGAH